VIPFAARAVREAPIRIRVYLAGTAWVKAAALPAMVESFLMCRCAPSDSDRGYVCGSVCDFWETGAFALSLVPSRSLFAPSPCLCTRFLRLHTRFSRRGAVRRKKRQVTVSKVHLWSLLVAVLLSAALVAGAAGAAGEGTTFDKNEDDSAEYRVSDRNRES
jgi:hypothetical protein